MTTSNNQAVKQLIYSLLTTNTGSHPLDRGRIKGRHWEENQEESLEDFESEPECLLGIRRFNDEGIRVTPVISIYHYLTKILFLDELCNEFNALPVNDWDSDDYYGVSAEGQKWLDQHEFEPLGDTFNSEWGETCLSQAVQGETFKVGDKYYTLLQIHGGADASQGYTDAKLFRLEDEHHLYQENCIFKLNECDGFIYKGGDWFSLDDKEIDFKEVQRVLKDIAKEDWEIIEGKLLSRG